MGRTVATLAGFAFNGHFVYRAAGETVEALCGETLRGPFRPAPWTCRRCIANYRAWERRAGGAA